MTAVERAAEVLSRLAPQNAAASLIRADAQALADAGLLVTDEILRNAWDAGVDFALAEATAFEGAAVPPTFDEWLASRPS